MAFTIQTDELSRIGYLRESTFGTNMLNSGNYKELIVPRGVRIDPAVTKSDLDQNRDSRVLHLADLYNDTYTGPVVCTIPEMICTKDRFADMLFACLQNRASEGLVGTGYSKVFNLHSSQPDFTANAGYFFSLAWKGPIAAKGFIVTSCIVRKMEIDIDKSQTGEKNLVYLKNIEIIGKKFNSGTTHSGTWVAPATAGVFNSHSFTFTDITNTNATPAWLRFSLKLDNGAVPMDRDTDGTPKTFYLNPPRLSMATVEMTHWYNADAATRDFIAALVANTNLNAKLVAGSADTDGFFSINWFGVVEGNPQASENKQMVMPVKYIIGDTAVALGLTITVADAISQG